MKDKVSDTRKYFNYSVTLIGLLLIIGSLYTFIYDYISMENSIYISSKVTSIDVNSNAADVKYTVNNKEYESKIPNTNDYAVNDKVMIRVSIKNPLKHVNKHLYISVPALIIGILLLVITLKKSLEYLKKAKNIRNLRLTGIYVQATITEIFVNSLGKKYKNYFPYKLRAKYLNPADNNIYTFDSEDTFINLSDILGKYGTKWVVVYIDKTNPNNYYVDLNSLIPHVDLIDPIEFMKIKPVTEGQNTDSENNNEGMTNDNQTSVDSDKENVEQTSK